MGKCNVKYSVSEKRDGDHIIWDALGIGDSLRTEGGAILRIKEVSFFCIINDSVKVLLVIEYY